MKKIFTFALGLVLTACTAAPKTVETPGAAGVDRGPAVVIDSPANGTIAQLNTLVIQAHASDPLGVARGEISANNQILGIIEAPGHGKTTETLTYSWQPRGPGDYQIGLRAQNTYGTWSPVALVHVVISEPTMAVKVEPTAPASLIATATATTTMVVPTQLAPTASPTVSVTQTVTAEPPPYTNADTGGYGISMLYSFSALHFYAQDANCFPNDSGLTVIVSDATNVYNVFAYFAMTDTGVYHFPDHRWTTGLWMWQSAPGSQYFWRKITSKTIIAEVPYYPNYVLYQFVATNRYGTIIGRSPIYRDMSIVACKN
jgi:hypothetical protein